MEREKERRRREPFNDLAKRLDELIDSSTRASEFMVEANRIQTEIATEIKAGGDSTDRHAKTNIKLTVLVIFITLTGIGITVWSILSGISFSPHQQMIFENQVDRITAGIVKNQAESEKAIARETAQNQRLIQLVTEGIQRLEDNAAKSENYKSLIQALEEANAQQREQLEKLEKRIIELEQGNNKPNKAVVDNSEAAPLRATP
jgi:uncharacterized protein Yka (UPF0111/DUF47 family)